MEIRRKAIYAFITAAVMLNISFGLINNGIPLPLRDIIDDPFNDENTQDEFIVPALREGGIYTSNHNMTLDIERDSNPEEDRGTYAILGTASRSILSDMIKKDLVGPYEFSYQYNETDDISITGDLQRGRDTHIAEGGIPVSEKVSTVISVTGPKGIGSTSVIESELNDVSSLRSDHIWKALIPGDGIITPSSNGSIETDMNLQEAGLSFEKIILHWKVGTISENIDGRRVTIEAYSQIGQRGEVLISLSMLEDCPWPESMSIEIHGTFVTDEGPTTIDLFTREDLEYWSPGKGAELPFRIYEPLGPPVSSEGGGEHILVPDEGGNTPYRSSPMEAVEFCLEEGSLLDDLRGKYQWDQISATDIVYEKNDTVDRMWTWNITLAAPPSNGVSESVNMEIGVEGGGIIDKKRFTLISETGDRSFRYADPGREMITLSDNENILRDTENGDQFFRSGDHSNSYRLDIVRRGTISSDIGSVLFMNMLGVEKAQVKDVFISRAIDRSNPSKMYLVVVDGSQGNLISTTTIEGAGVPLFNAYDFDLA